MDIVPSRAVKVSAILAEAEHDCSAHQFHVSVYHTPAVPAPTRRPEIIAALLRILAEHTDGWCAVRGATDDTLTTTGMVFAFTSDRKRDEFIKKRIALYLDPVVRTQLSITKI